MATAPNMIRPTQRRGGRWVSTNAASSAPMPGEARSRPRPQGPAWNTSRANAQHLKDVYADIRSSLDEEDQTLLVLRVDRELAWRDIAIVLLGEEAPADDVTRKAASLRKQFERVKVQLRELAATRIRD